MAGRLERGQREMFPDIERRPKPVVTPERRGATGPRPLKTRECADWMGVSLDYVRVLIKDGTLKAKHERRSGKSRGMWLIQQQDFIDCLKRLKWSRIPKIG